MASVVAEANVWTNTMTVPDDGDTRSAASVTAAGVGFQVAADRTRYLRNRLVGAVGGTIQIPMAIKYNSTHFAYASVGGIIAGQVSQTNIAAAGAIWFDVPYIFGASLTAIGMTWDGDFEGGGPRAGLPGTMPTISLRTLDALTGAAATVGTTTDPTALLATYELPHEVTLSVAAQVFTPTTLLQVRITGETGANAATFSGILRLYGTIATV